MRTGWNLGHRRVCLTSDAREGWWSDIAGPGKPLDSDRWRILSFDFLGGSGESTGPQSGDTDFPSLSTFDQARALEQLLDALGIGALRAIAGGSYGGMVGLAFAERYPDRVANLLVIGASDRAHPMASAWRSTQRRMVRLRHCRRAAAHGMELARALAMTTYRSSEEFAARFDAPPERVGGRFEFPVEQYLAARGRDYAAHYSAESFPVPLGVHRSASGGCGAHFRPDHGGGNPRGPSGAAAGYSRHGGPAGSMAACMSCPRSSVMTPFLKGNGSAARHLRQCAGRCPVSHGPDPVTLAVRAGLESDDQTGAVVPPIHLSTTYAFRGFEEKRAYDYSRSGNPTRDLLAKALADLEGGVGATVLATGMAAITLVGHLLPVGARIVAPHDCYGGTYRLFDAWQRRGELRCDFVDFADAQAVSAALKHRTALLWIETPSNPLLRITDIARFAEMGHAAGALVVVDNTFLSPPGAEALKPGRRHRPALHHQYLNGHSDVVGGAVIAGTQALHEQLGWWANCLGLTGAAFDSYLTLRDCAL